MKPTEQKKKHMRLLMAEMTRCVDILNILHASENMELYLVEYYYKPGDVTELKRKLREVRRDSLKMQKMLSHGWEE